MFAVCYNIFGQTSHNCAFLLYPIIFLLVTSVSAAVTGNFAFITVAEKNEENNEKK